MSECTLQRYWSPFPYSRSLISIVLNMITHHNLLVESSLQRCLGYFLFYFFSKAYYAMDIFVLPKVWCVQFSSVQLLSCVWLFATPWIAACQASLSITNSRSLLKLMSIESVMPSSHLILCRPLLLLPPIPPSIRVFSNESTLCMRCPKYWSFSFNVIPSKEHPGLI